MGLYIAIVLAVPRKIIFIPWHPLEENVTENLISRGLMTRRVKEMYSRMYHNEIIMCVWDY